MGQILHIRDGSGLLTLRRHIPDAVTHFSDVTAPLPSSSSAIIYCSARVVAAVQDEKLQDDKINQPVSKLIERNRLKTVLKNLSLLKLLRSSNNRIQELHSLAKRCWKSMLRVPKMLQISSGDNNVCNKVKQNNGEFQEIRALEKKPESKKAESIGKSKTKTSNGWKSTEGSKGSPAAVPWRKEKAKSKVPKTRASLGLHTRGQKRKPQVKKPQAVFLKTYHHRTPMRDTKPLDVTDQFVWFEGLPTRIRPPGRRIMCRASTFRCTKRPCTRFCSVSL
ncbi:TP53-target gene 5 protein isoform X1 [Cricetulus griseus]|nr:TP53-target gene 5 protein isoform X1 [Cricetulus griseus]